MKNFFINSGITFAIISIFFWLLPTGWWLLFAIITFLFRLLFWFTEKRKADKSLASAQANFTVADYAINNPPTGTSAKRLDALQKEQADAKKTVAVEKKNIGVWQAFVKSNNLDFIIGFFIFLCFLSATVNNMRQPPLPRDLPITTSLWYRLEKAWLGEKRANQWLQDQEYRQGKAFPPSEGRSWECFASWKGTFVSFLIMLVLFFWSISDELHKTKRYLFEKDKRGDIMKEGDHSGLFLFIAGLAGFHEVIQWFHIKKKKGEL